MKKHILRILHSNTFISTFFLIIATLLAFILFHLVPENNANVALIYIVALILIARYTKGYFYGFFASLFCVFAINYCFTYPYFEFNFTLTGYPITFLELLIVTLITSTTTSHMIEQGQKLAAQEKKIAEADREKMRANLLRAISHDLRTPLTGIIGSSSSLIENHGKMSEQDNKELIQAIYDDASWLRNMVENLLSVTRIQSDTSTIKKSIEIVEEVVSEAVSRLKKRIPDARINVTIPKDIIMLPMDAMLIEQVLINLLENSIIHSHSELPVDLTVTETSHTIVFQVDDYGIGIAEERLPILFDGIPSTASNTADSQKGVGIGLSICKTIVLAHKGEIHAENRDNGATFLFSLPKTE
ncbi:MAG: DUF4118 domain-containing protein [Lachnospiraceae bacterium]|nr:DUF4118 domain-containing protein [Lachnospiraceae bacterium]